jgi:RHS repeat-associated protein
MFGTGWRLSLPWIQRRTSNGLPTYSQADEFANEGDEKLIRVAESHTVSTYRKEIEKDFRRYRFLHDQDIWVVDLPDGAKEYFGETLPGSAVSSKVKFNSAVFTWMPSRFIDRNGNESQFFYTNFADSPYQVYLSEIRYNITRQAFAYIRFSYTPRDDVFDDYRPGFRLRNAYLCSSISIGTHESQVRRYQLSYKNPSGLSLLSEVRLFGSDNSTALPPLQFDYTQFQLGSIVAATQPFAAGSAVIGGRAEILDVNGDGLPDIVQTVGNRGYWYPNEGKGRWGQREMLANPVPLQLDNPAVNLADMDGDMRADLVIKEGTAANPMRYFRMMPDGTWATKPVLFAPGSIDVNLDDPNVRFIDLNNDRRMDVMYTGSKTTWQYWINLGADANGVHQWRHLTGRAPVAGTFSSGLRLADMNGDGLLDVVSVTPDGVAYWPNSGNGTWGDRVDMGQPPHLGNLFSGVQLVDVNGDGWSDLLLIESGHVRLWLNHGGSFFEPEQLVEGTPSVDSHTTIRFADLNGNGSTDILWIRDNVPATEQIVFLDLSPVKANLLRVIDNGLGKRITLKYATSTELAIEDADKGSPWHDFTPAPIHVVVSITTDDGLGDRSEAQLQYHDAYYGLDERRFAGFQNVHVLAPAEDSTEAFDHSFTFNVGRDSKWRRGAIESEEIRGGQNQLLRRIDRTWNERELVRGLENQRVAALFVSSEGISYYEGQATPARSRTDFEYDTNGNRTAELVYGLVGPGDTVSAGNDETLTRREFAEVVDAEHWILRYKIREWVTDLSGKTVSESKFLYDGLLYGKVSRGNLTSRLDWLDSERRFLTRLEQEFDSFGNIISLTNGRGNQRTRGYDPTFCSYLIREALKLGDYSLVLEADVDPGFGTVVSSRGFFVEGEPSVQATRYLYDSLGRLIAIIRPGDTSDLPTEKYAYFLANPTSYVEVQQRLTSGEARVRRSRIFYDGFSRPMGTKVRLNNDHWVLEHAQRYNTRGTVTNEWPALEVPDGAWNTPGASLPHWEHKYDGLDREIELLHPDGSFTSTAYEPLTRYVSPENANSGNRFHVRPWGQYRIYHYDGQGRLVEADEHHDNVLYATRYEYDTSGNLVAITDANNNRRIFAYDSLGRKRSSDDPDTGHRAFEYDAANNLTEVLDAAGQRRRYTYDAAERILEEQYLTASDAVPKLAVEYHYDRLSNQRPDGADAQLVEVENAAGRLSWVRDEAGEEHYFYDAHGNTILRCRRLALPPSAELVSYWLRESFDARDQLVSRTFPDNDSLLYRYNDRGLVAAVEGSAGGYAILKSIEYAASGQVERTEYGNGIVGTEQFDQRLRPTTMLLSAPNGVRLLDYTYQYDASSNITAISDQRALPDKDPRLNSQQFRYDDLDRLEEYRLLASDNVSIRGLIQYKYDAVGNLVFKSSAALGSNGHVDDPAVNVGTLAYGGAFGQYNRTVRTPTDPPGPHNVTTTQSGLSFDYTANGAIARTKDVRFIWDTNDRVSEVHGTSSIAHYRYDYQGRRVMKEVVSGGLTTWIAYPFDSYEVSNSGPPVKWVLLGQRRVAEITGMAARNRERVQQTLLSPGWNSLTLYVSPSDSSVSKILGAVVSSPGLAIARETGGRRIRLQPSSQLHPGVRYWVRSNKYCALNIRGAVSPDVVLPNSGFAYFHTDQVGSVTLVTDLQAHPVAETMYYPEGLRRGPFSSESLPAFYRYTGKEWDAESGLYYYGARYYDPEIAQFMSADPLYSEIDRALNFPSRPEDSVWFNEFLENPLRNNLYAYARRNPVRFSDPSGAEAIDQLQLTLAGIGFVPGPAGQVANLTNACISAYRGDYVGMGLSLLAAVPVAGVAAGVQMAEHLAVAAESTVWSLAPLARGNAIETMLSANLPRTFPTIDRFVNGVATSIKSIDLRAASYQNAARLEGVLSRYVGLLEGFSGARLGTAVVEGSQVTSKVLEVAVPQGAISAAQQAVLTRVSEDAARRGIQIVVTTVK